MIGRTVKHYQILKQLGEGGMGVVYKARDTHLDRPVAIKVLAPDAVANVERKRRFVQEAKAASALNHPNIVHVYDIDSADGVDFIAMEYVAGKTLHECIGRKALPIGEALSYAIQIADALAAAHACGIVHRDIKPANIMACSGSSGGLAAVKILDFGLAKLSERGDGGYSGSTQTLGPRTEEGTILGTVAYMSPEQAEGKPVDARSDIFSFGALLYEMVTGRRAFEGDTKVSILASILHKQPTPIREIARAVPLELERLITHCLTKDPGQRLHSMYDVRLLLEDLREAAVAGPVAAPSTPRRWLGPLIWAAGMLIAGTGLAMLWLPSSGPDLKSYRLTPFSTEAAEENSPAWSRDGRTLAYEEEVEGIKQIHTRGLDAPAGTRLTNSRSNCVLPFWSPDGNRIYYISAGQLWSVGGAGGAPQLVMKDVQAASISPDGKTLAFVRGTIGTSSLWIASPPQANPRQYRQPSFPEHVASFSAPQFSPDGSKIGVLVSREAGASQPELWILPYPSGSPLQAPVRLQGTQGRGSRLSWTPNSRHIVLAAGMGGDTRLNIGDARLYVVDTQTSYIQPLTLTTQAESQPAVSPDGRRIAFASGAVDFDVIQIGIDGSPIRNLLATSRSERMPTWSPLGTQYAYVTNANVAEEIWLRSMQEGWARPLVRRDADLSWFSLQRPRLSPDGRRISYDVFGRHHVIAISSVTGGQPVIPDQESPDQHGSSWSPDGNWIAYRRLNAGKWELVKRPLGGGTPVWLEEAGEAGGDTDWSPTGEWLCHQRGASLHLVSADGARHVVAASPGTAAFGFSRDGATLYAVRQNSARRWELVAFAVPSGKEKKAMLLALPIAASVAGFSLHPDGKSFITSVGTARYDIWLLEGFRQPTVKSFWHPWR